MFLLNKPGESIPTDSITDIEQSVWILCSLIRGEVPYNPNMGLDLSAMIGASFDSIPQSQKRVERDIRDLLQVYEPRANIFSIEADFNQADKEGSRHISVTFLTEISLDLLTVEIGLNRG